MKYIVALLILVAGISAEKCSQEEAENCVKSLIASALGDDSDEDTCRQLESSLNCLKDLQEECPGVEQLQSPEVLEALQVFENVLEENCKAEVAGISDEKCSKERAETCIKGMVASAAGDHSNEETCRELESSINCVKELLQCPGEDENQSIEFLQAIQSSEKVLEENCKAEAAPAEADEDIKACWKENEPYLFECIQEAATQALTAVKESGNDDISEDAMTCSIYALTASCLINRVTQKCGEEAGMLIVEHVVDMPDDIAESCSKTEGFAAHAIQLLEDKRKK